MLLIELIFKQLLRVMRLLILACLIVTISADLQGRSFRPDPLIVPGVTASGYIPVTKEGDALFYIFVESTATGADIPLVIWLQGGPGCSSIFGMYVENGPYLIQPNGSFVANPYAWSTIAHLLYVDQPVGTGFSYVTSPNDYVRNESQIAAEFYVFLQGFFNQYPKLRSADLYIVGESYAGMYVPSISYEIYTQNINNAQMPPINLRGLGLGDGWVDPYYQTKAYLTYGYAMGLIDDVQLAAGMQYYYEYLGLVEAGHYDKAYYLENFISDYVLNTCGGGVDSYNILYTTDPTNAPTNALGAFLNQADVKQQLGVGNQNWTDCTPIVNTRLIGDQERSRMRYLADLLNANFSVLIYNGNVDFICNLMGTNEYIMNMNWQGSDAFAGADRVAWFIGTGNSMLAGYARSGGGLTQVIVRNAGHMVPFYQPAAALDMLSRFISDTPFD